MPGRESSTACSVPKEIEEDEIKRNGLLTLINTSIVRILYLKLVLPKEVKLMRVSVLLLPLCFEGSFPGTLFIFLFLVVFIFLLLNLLLMDQIDIRIRPTRWLDNILNRDVLVVLARNLLS